MTRAFLLGFVISPPLALEVIVTHTNSDTGFSVYRASKIVNTMQPTPPKPPKKTPETELLETNVAAADDLIPEAPANTTLDTTAKNYYQAIGWLRGVVKKGEERYYVQIRDANFTLYLPRRAIAVAAALEGKLAWIKCYPQSKGEGLSFKVVWMGTEQHEKSDPGIFVLRGVWQFIPQCRRPVFSVYRNELKSYENRPNNQHLPLIWSDQPPYRFRKDSEERPKFYQILARLIPQRNCFGFVEQIAEPVEQTPRRVKKTPFNPDSSEKKSEHGHKGEKQENSLESPENLELNQGETGPLPAEKLDDLDTDNGDRQPSSGATSLTEEPSNGSTEAVVESESSLEPELPAESKAKKTTSTSKAKTTKTPKTTKTTKAKTRGKTSPPEV
ncbi:hypothetical protein BWK47_14660 [Synechocystis sp. CACIAM 05]|nr:hypothetical protein BWK47_14660 [Synechocystis sp. CACIAM 05]